MKHLLNSVNLIISKYKEIEKVSGEHYNIFSVMGMENSEVKTHSAIIGDLLNANGSHFMGDVFLKLFIETVQRQSESQKLKDFKFETEHSNCLVEEFKGKKNAEEITGGRIDLVIKDAKGEVIVIENKIFAPEQENQIQRYKNEYPDGMMLFLTLDGKDSVSAGNLVIDEDYHLICYEKTIINWLELCLKETFNQPILGETLKQYIVLIKKLTNQSTNKNMSEEIINIIESNFEASAEIYKNFQKVLEIKQSYFLKNLSESIEVELNKSNRANWDVKICQESNDKLANKVEIISKDLNVSFHFKNYKNPLILINRNSGNTEDTESQFKKIRDDLGFKAPDWKTETTLLWQHKWNNLGDAENLINAEKLNKHEEISDFLMEVIDNIDEALCSKKPKQ